MKIQKKQAIGENLLYVMVWTAIILVPVLNSQMMSEMHVNLENVLTAWRYIAPYLIIFLIQDVYKRQPWNCWSICCASSRVGTMISDFTTLSGLPSMSSLFSSGSV